MCTVHGYVIKHNFGILGKSKLKGTGAKVLGYIKFNRNISYA